MTILTDLRAALDTYEAAEAAYYDYDRSDVAEIARRLDDKMRARSVLFSKLFKYAPNRGDIASHEGDATIPAVVQDAQQYVAAHIERLETEYPCRGVMDCERCEHRIPPDECAVLAINARHKAERDALLAEHEAVAEGYGDETADGGCDCLSCRIIRAHNNAERVIHGE